MSNLWEETIKFLEENGKTFEDVLFIQGEDFKVTKENFEIVAKKTNYDDGFGAQHVATDLVLVEVVGGLSELSMMDLSGGN